MVTVLGKGTVLLIDGSQKRSADLRSRLREAGYNVLTESSARSALRLIHSRCVNAIALSSQIDDMHFRTFLQSVRKANVAAGVVVYGPDVPTERAVEWMKSGAVDVLAEPIQDQRLREAIQLAFRHSSLYMEDHGGKTREGREDAFLYRTKAMDQIMRKVHRVAPLKTTVLITGESGTGKDLLAKKIHELSGRGGPYIPINCAAIPETLLEGELFGHEKGAFTGADRTRQGKFEAADGGTLLLDEIGEIPKGTQVKLLRVLEEEQVTRLGGNVPVPVDVRLLAATNRDLEELVADGSFREDLYYRIKVVEIDLPPLRSRKADVPLLTMSFLRQLAEKHDIPIPELSPEARQMLADYDWPGNVRQLRNVVESLLITAGDRISVPDLPPEISGESAPEDRRLVLELPSTVSEAEEKLIEKTLDLVDGNRTKAAKLLGIGRRTLQRKIGRN